MEELKTLKDLKIFSAEADAVSFIDLKQIAVEHIKDLQRESLDAYWKNIHEKSAIPKIMEIFDLTEEDLK